MGGSGPRFFSELRKSSNELRRNHTRALEKLRKTRAEVEALVSERGEAVLNLAHEFLPEVTEEAVAGTFREIRSELQDVLRRRERRVAELETLLAEAESSESEQQSELDATTEALNAKVEEREQLEVSVADTLAEDAEFKRVSDAAAYAESRLSKNEGRIAELEHESKEKLPAYENDKLFMYLVRRGFGTPGYKARGLTRRLDRWIAGMVDFDHSKRSFDFLRATPELVRNEIARRREVFEVLMQDVEERRDKVEAEIGLDAVLEAGEALGDRREELVASLAKLRSENAKRRAELELIESHDGEFKTEALAKFRRFLGSAETKLLAEKARMTPEPTDDRLVADIRRAEERLEELEPRLAKLERESSKANERLSELDDIVSRYRGNNFDSARSYFDDDEPRKELERFVDGYMDADDLWKVIRKRQRFREPKRPKRYQQRDTRQRRGAPPPLPRGAGRSRSVVTDSVIDLVEVALRQAMGRGISRRGWRGGWSLPSNRGGGPWSGRSGGGGGFPKRRSSSSRSKSSRRRGSKRKKGGGFTTIDGF